MPFTSLRPHAAVRLPVTLAAATALVASSALAQPAAPTPAGPGALPPLRALGAVTATSAEALGSLAAARQLPGGKVLVNDVAKRRVLLFDATLASFTVVADSTAATGNAYSGRMGGLLPFRGDTTLFVDPQSLSMLTITPAGTIGRTLAVPRPDDAMALTGLGFGTPGLDARGRLVYRPMPRPRFGGPGASGGPVSAPVFPDSAAIVAVDLTTRQVDTVAFVKTQKITMQVSQTADGRVNMSSLIDPLPVVDEWTVLADGTVMLLRGRDFHAEVVGADGKLTAMPRTPYPWQRLDDQQKVVLLDSVKTAMEKARAEAATRMAAGGPGAVFGGAGGGMGAAPMIVMRSGPGGGEPPARGGAARGANASASGGTGGGPNGGGAGGPGGFPMPQLNFVPASELPDYKPAFGPGSARPDRDGRVWVRTIPTEAHPGSVYHVLDREGKLVDRVLLPPKTEVVGFGPGGVVYLGMRDADNVLRLQRAQVR